MSEIDPDLPNFFCMISCNIEISDPLLQVTYVLTFVILKVLIFKVNLSYLEAFPIYCILAAAAVTAMTAARPLTASMASLAH